MSFEIISGAASGTRTHDLFVNSVDAAKILNWSVGTLYNRKNDVGSYVKVGNRLMFSKRAIKQRMASGTL